MLKDSGLGCHIGTNFMGAVEYADDIVLLAPSVRFRFGGSYDVTFNVSKYQLIHYNNYRDEFNGVNYNDFFIKKSAFAYHLGNVIGPNPNKLYDLAINKFNFQWDKCNFRKSLCECEISFI